ncbi:low molecular weight phosphatase family protein [Candidatus Woesearchaeota archaeon]|nr:low molecular weight phosphatase family protein [Candidatus Woesearchaeota archaeon]
MKLLFVCMENVARSQIAEALFPDPIHEVISAGIDPRINKSRTLVEIGAFGVIECMAQLGYHLGNRMVKELSPGMVRRADKIIVMADRMFWPQYLRLAKEKTEYWPIPDPKGAPVWRYAQIRDTIKHLIYDDEKGLARRLSIR